MPTVITHAAVPLCIGLGLGSKVIPPRLLFAGIILAMLPDADAYCRLNLALLTANVFGHRGFTHSLVFAFVVLLLCVLIDADGSGWADSLLAVFNCLVAIAQLAGFGNHWGGKGAWLLWPWLR